MCNLRPDADPRTRREWWDLGGNRQPYRLVCRYEGLEAGIMANVPAAARRCEVTAIRENSRGVRHGRVVSGPEQVVVACRYETLAARAGLPDHRPTPHLDKDHRAMKIVGLSGSLRRASLNTALLHAAATLMPGRGAQRRDHPRHPAV